MQNQNEITLYGLFDAALIPKVWFNLEVWGLRYEPLYRGDYREIVQAIPYLIELNQLRNKTAVTELITDKTYHQGLFISSTLTLDKLVERLGYFYHVVNKQNVPCLRRFFDLRIFTGFLATLTPTHCAYLFEHQTTFYYKDSFGDFYHGVHYQKNQLHWFQTETLDFDNYGK